MEVHRDLIKVGEVGKQLEKWVVEVDVEALVVGVSTAANWEEPKMEQLEATVVAEVRVEADENRDVAATVAKKAAAAEEAESDYSRKKEDLEGVDCYSAVPPAVEVEEARTCSLIFGDAGVKSSSFSLLRAEQLKLLNLWSCCNDITLYSCVGLLVL